MNINMPNLIEEYGLLIACIDITLLGIIFLIYDIVYTIKTQTATTWQPVVVASFIGLITQLYGMLCPNHIVMDICIFIFFTVSIFSIGWKTIYCQRAILGNKAKYMWAFFGLGIIWSFLLITYLTISDLKSNFKSVTTTELQNILDNISLTEDSIIYIGRPTCPACEIAKPKLEELIDNYKIPAYYYNTDVARNDDEATMTELLNSLEITSVPTIISLKGNVVYDILNGDDIDTQLENFLDNNYLPLI
ncbi:MAG: hypothetical protein ATN36_02760 [Epulopiscium sp. Nele67-Bin005]|nr:MAG: hypothetical protein ATN36_02760 [Epulopiscium sp. Nele67-Bin005]